MPIIIPEDLPASSALALENIFVMHKERAVSQDIRPIEIAILNLMPTKVETETQLMRLLGNTPLQVKITLVETSTYRGKHISERHLDKFYKSLDEIKKCKFDGMIVTGAPVETLPFNEVKYWKELEEIFDYIDDNVTSTIFICWGAQAALYYYYGINKHLLSKKLFGVFPSVKVYPHEPLLKGMDDFIYIPHSRHTGIDVQKVKECPNLQILAESEEAGPSIIKSADSRRIFLLGHSEYERDTLKNEYLRDINKGMNIDKPVNYFIGDTQNVDMCWSGTANLFYYNWLNYYVYQITPFELDNIKKPV